MDQGLPAPEIIDQTPGIIGANDQRGRTSTDTARAPSTRPDLSRTIPYWFLAFVGLIYASGFLVVSDFLETYGLRDAGAELWKTRYIHIGVFCLMATVIPNAVTYLLIQLLPTKTATTIDPLPYKGLRVVSSISIYIELELGFFASPMFGRHV